MTIYLSCRPFNRYWQISPDPGNTCQAAVSRPIIWVMFIGNVVTDVYLFIVPLPMLWQSSLKTYKKLAATVVLSGGILIVVCAILKSVFVLVVSTFPHASPPPLPPRAYFRIGKTAIATPN
jgi:hypothetical protein